jgi:hypothetical protein
VIAPAALIRDSGTISLIPPTDKTFPIIVKSSEVVLLPAEYTKAKTKSQVIWNKKRVKFTSLWFHQFGSQWGGNIMANKIQISESLIGI